LGEAKQEEARLWRHLARQFITGRKYTLEIELSVIFTDMDCRPNGIRCSIRLRNHLLKMVLPISIVKQEMLYSLLLVYTLPYNQCAKQNVMDPVLGISLYLFYLNL